MSAMSNHVIHYPEMTNLTYVPSFPSPSAWFQWGQRYIYEQMESQEISRMNGYGDYYPDLSLDKLGCVGKQNIWLSGTDTDAIESSSLLAIESYRPDFASDSEGLHWLMYGMNRIRFDKALLIFDYPLVLGKKWVSKSSIRSIIPVKAEGKIVAFIPAGIKAETDILRAPGTSYRLPLPVSEIPRPRKELASSEQELSWENLQQKFASPEAEELWNNVRIPAGTRQGEALPGYFVTQVCISVFGKTVLKQEIWKDVRGCVPVYVIDSYFPLSLGRRRSIKLAKVWSGNIPGIFTKK